MIKVELTTDTEMFPAGAVLSVDEKSAAARKPRRAPQLRDRQAPAPPGHAGGGPARALNQQATAAAESTNDNDSEAGEDGEDDD